MNIRNPITAHRLKRMSQRAKLQRKKQFGKNLREAGNTAVAGTALVATATGGKKLLNQRDRSLDNQRYSLENQRYALSKQASLGRFLVNNPNDFDDLALEYGFDSGQDLLEHSKAPSMLKPALIKPQLEQVDEHELRLLGHSAGNVLETDRNATSLATEATILAHKKAIDARNRERIEDANRQNVENEQELKLKYAEDPDFRAHVDAHDEKRTLAKSLLSTPVSFGAKYEQQSRKADGDTSDFDQIAEQHGFDSAADAMNYANDQHKMTFAGLRSSAVSHNELVNKARSLSNKLMIKTAGNSLPVFLAKIGVKEAPYGSGEVKKRALLEKEADLIATANLVNKAKQGKVQLPKSSGHDHLYLEVGSDGSVKKNLKNITKFAGIKNEGRVLVPQVVAGKAQLKKLNFQKKANLVAATRALVGKFATNVGRGAKTVGSGAKKLNSNIERGYRKLNSPTKSLAGGAIGAVGWDAMSKDKQ